MDIALLAVGLLLLVAGAGFLIVPLRIFCLDSRLKKLGRMALISLWLALAAVALGAGAIQTAIVFFNGWDLTGGEWWMAILGAMVFCFSSALLAVSFVLHYYKTSLEQPQAKYAFWGRFAMIPLAFASFLVMMEGVAKHFSYPLVSGFSINGNGWTWTTAADSPYQSLHVAFYGIIMLFGAFVVYWICDHAFYQKFHKHGLLDTVFLICFPAGVICARIWYVVGDWEIGGFSKDFSRVFQIWDGGLTIMGGALGGIVAGIIFFLLARKYISVRWATDIIVPAILVAQAIGRWGNFFNCEVYGAKVSLSQGWQWLPTWIANQLRFIPATKTYLPIGQIHVPLFLIESAINLAGYFIIRFGIGRFLKKWLAQGDLAASYLIWYGIVRIIMEPLRDPEYNMGNNGMWSVWGSAVYILLGLLVIIALHLFDYLKAKKQRDLDKKNV